MKAVGVSGNQLTLNAVVLIRKEKAFSLLQSLKLKLAHGVEGTSTFAKNNADFALN